MDSRFEPDSDFVSRLEWQLKSELRRRQSLLRKRRSPLTSRWLRRLLLVALSALAGFAVATAARRFQDMEKQQLTRAKAEATVELLRARMKLMQAWVAETEEVVRERPEEQLQLEYARFEGRLVSRELARALLDLEETELTGDAPDNSITAPVVSGRDFVKERLMIELETREERADYLHRDLEQSLASLADDNDPHLLALERELSLAEQSEKEIKDLIELRRSFLDGEETAEEIVRLTELAQAEERLQSALRKLEFAQSAALRMAVGEKDEGSLMEKRQANFELTVAKIEARLAQMEVDYLQSASDPR